MGNVYGNMQQPPAGALTVTIESSGCTCEPIQGRKWDAAMAKPPQASDWSPQRWSDFSSRMATLVGNFKRDGLAYVLLLLVLVAILPMSLEPLIIGITGRGDDDCDGSRNCSGDKCCEGAFPVHLFILVAGIAAYYALSSKLKKINQQVDQQIEQLCSEFSDSGVTVQYVTMFTGVCKPKGAHTSRLLYISKGTSAQATAVQAVGQMMQVTCPPGAKAGDTVQLSTALGAMQVVIPSGVSEGMVFQMQMPAQPVVAQAQAVAVPVQPSMVVAATAVTPGAVTAVPTVTGSAAA